MADDLDAQSVAECPVTVGVPSETQEWKDVFYFGGEVLSVQLFVDGWWHGSDQEANYRGKLWWFSQEYNGLADSVPLLEVRSRRLDVEYGRGTVSTVTNAKDSEGNWAMLSVLEFSEPGCWEVEGEYGGQKLSFVVLVGEHRHNVASDT